MNVVSLNGTARADMGKKAARDLRAAGNVLGVIYGGEQEVHFYAPILDFRKIVYTSEFNIIEITVDGKTYRTITKDTQFDVVTDQLNHVDFLELVEGKKIIANLPIKFNGTPAGVKAGGKLQIRSKTLKVRTLPENLVDSIGVDITGLQLLGNVRVQDVVAENMEIMAPARQPLASVVMTRALRQAESEAAKGKK